MQSASSQIIEQIKVVEEVVLSEVSNLSDSVINKNQGDQTQSFWKNGFAIVTYFYYLLTHWLMVSVTK